MSVKFGTDGTIYCNTVRYNYKQARNMIADGCYGNISGTEVWANVVASTNPAGYKSHRSFNLQPSKELTQNLPAFVEGRKYYFSCRVYSETRNANSFVQIFYGNDTVFWLSQVYSSWTLVSGVFTASSVGSTHYIRMKNNGTEGNTYISRLILVDLTDTFGRTYEPSKEWCDNNIREQETICNKGNVSNNVTYSNIATRYTGSNLSKTDYNYLQLDSNWEPRDYMYYLQGLADYSEGYLNSASSFTLDNTKTYYAYVEQHTQYVSGVTQSVDFYFPVAEPYMGQVALVDATSFNSGGGMFGWKRVSAYAERTSFTNGSYTSRFDFNNMKQTNVQRITAFNIINLTPNITQYNNYNGTTITINDVNKEWCDRWIDGRSSPIIHIKDPDNTSIKFNTDYDIVCNDIEIRPELNKIIFDGNTGTIKCKKLVRTQAY